MPAGEERRPGGPPVESKIPRTDPAAEVKISYAVVKHCKAARQKYVGSIHVYLGKGDRGKVNLGVKWALLIYSLTIEYIYKFWWRNKCV